MRWRTEGGGEGWGEGGPAAPAPAPSPGPAPSPAALRATLLLAPLLVLAAWASLLAGDPSNVRDLASGETWRRASDFLGALLGRVTPLSPTGGAERFRSLERWVDMGRLAYETLVMSVLAIWISVAGMLVTVMAGARPAPAATSRGLLAHLRAAAFFTTRGAWVLARAVPELVWALLLVLVLPPGVLAGALALGLHNFGIVGKLCSEVVEDLDPGPAKALRAGGAGPLQVLVYAVLPQALPQFLTYALYRWEVVIRTTIVVGFVAAGGLGREFRLAMSFFHFTDVAMILLTYFTLVLLVDLVSGALRALARG